MEVMDDPIQNQSMGLIQDRSSLERVTVVLDEAHYYFCVWGMVDWMRRACGACEDGRIYPKDLWKLFPNDRPIHVPLRIEEVLERGGIEKLPDWK